LVVTDIVKCDRKRKRIDLTLTKIREAKERKRKENTARLVRLRVCQKGMSIEEPFVVDGEEDCPGTESKVLGGRKDAAMEERKKGGRMDEKGKSNEKK